MNPTTVAIDLAKNVFELAMADEHWRVVGRERLTRSQFERWFTNRLVVMEACGSAHPGHARFGPAGSRCGCCRHSM